MMLAFLVENMLYSLIGLFGSSFTNASLLWHRQNRNMLEYAEETSSTTVACGHGQSYYTCNGHNVYQNLRECITGNIGMHQLRGLMSATATSEQTTITVIILAVTEVIAGSHSYAGMI